jgi:CheY-like chemotaxis protein
MLDWHDVSTWRVLVVDDERDNIEVLAETLEFRGVTVEIARNGEEGLATFQRFMPNLLLVDLSMPVMDGWQMRAKLKATAEYNGAPIVALTAHAMTGDRERALAVGFDGYLTKPINIMTLLEDIRTCIVTQLAIKES